VFKLHPHGVTVTSFCLYHNISYRCRVGGIQVACLLFIRPIRFIYYKHIVHIADIANSKKLIFKYSNKVHRHALYTTWHA